MGCNVICPHKEAAEGLGKKEKKKKTFPGAHPHSLMWKKQRDEQEHGSELDEQRCDNDNAKKMKIEA